jgi:hypothetical protein
MTSGILTKQYIGHRKDKLSSQGISKYGNAHPPPSLQCGRALGEANCFFYGLVFVSRRHLAEAVHVAAPSPRQRLHPRPPHDRYVFAQGQVEPPKCSGVSTLSSEPWVADLGLSLEAMFGCERRQSRAQQTNNQEPTTRQQHKPTSGLCPAFVEVKLECRPSPVGGGTEIAQVFLQQQQQHQYRNLTTSAKSLYSCPTRLIQQIEGKHPQAIPLPSIAQCIGTLD